MRALTTAAVVAFTSLLVAACDGGPATTVTPDNEAGGGATSSSSGSNGTASAEQNGSSNSSQGTSSNPTQGGSSNPSQSGSSTPPQSGLSSPPQSGSSTPPQSGSSTPPQSGSSNSAVPLSISGAPATSAVVGTNYSFTPVTNESGALTFSVTDAPSWTAFDPKTGTLDGTPSNSNIGTFPGIVIAVSDGSSTAVLATFAIRVTANPDLAGIATLSWSAPTTNVDGSIVTALSGYRIYYGTDARALDRTVEVDDGTATTYVLRGLAAGTWYFAVQALSAAGIESTLSDVAGAPIT